MLPELSAIKSRRQKLGIKQKELAKASLVSQSLIAKLESGKLAPSYDIVKRIFSYLDSCEHKKEKKCSDIMTRRIISINPREKIIKAIEVMKKNSISQIPVLDKDKNVGSISESLIFNKIANGISQKNLSETLVSEVMESPFPVLSADFPASLATPLLKQSNAILLIENKKLVGIITKADVI